MDRLRHWGHDDGVGSHHAARVPHLQRRPARGVQPGRQPTGLYIEHSSENLVALIQARVRRCRSCGRCAGSCRRRADSSTLGAPIRVLREPWEQVNVAPLKASAMGSSRSRSSARRAARLPRPTCGAVHVWDVATRSGISSWRSRVMLTQRRPQPRWPAARGLRLAGPGHRLGRQVRQGSCWTSRGARQRLRRGVRPDGKSLATAGARRTVRIWDTATGRPMRRTTRMRRGLVGRVQPRRQADRDGG